jgi:two-component system phosphate regulon sensor histidine kinase PhoR
MFRSIRWRIAIPYVLLILLVMGGLSVYLSHFVRGAHLSDLRSQLTAEARLAGDALAPLLAKGEAGETLDDLAKRWAGLLDARITIISPDGTVLGESHEDRTRMDNHLSRPEVQQALATGRGSSIRYSHTVHYDMMYAAVAVSDGGQVVGIVRVAVPLRQVEANVAFLRRTIVLAMVLTTVMTVLLALFIAGRTTRPVRDLTEVAERMAKGDLDARLFSTTRDEVGQLTHAFNRMADQLREKMVTLDEKQGRLTAILDNMADGVLITDGSGQVQLLNPAAARMLSVADGSAGRSFAQIVRDYRLVALWQECVEQCSEQVTEVEMGPQRLFLRAIISPLPGGDSGGFLVILQDLSEVRRLETVRRDFLSNISHELRTPLASLKALVDTLRDGALNDPPAAQHFVDRIETEVDALTQMVRELVELSRIESGQVPLRLGPTPITEIVLPPVDRLRPQAERAGIRLTTKLPSNPPLVLADAERVHQVVTNLVHNALKFTEGGGQVSVAAESVDGEVVVSVRDTGIGIPKDDLPRIFERFYKTDRARTGGGTGLGLSIAKHIVQAHGGRIWAESVEGEGSTFCFSLPVAGEAPAI